MFLLLKTMIDQLTDDVKLVRPAVEKTRANQVKNPDVDRLEEDVNRMTKRWGNCCMQVKLQFQLKFQYNSLSFFINRWWKDYEVVKLPANFLKNITCPIKVKQTGWMSWIQNLEIWRSWKLPEQRKHGRNMW